MIVNDTYRYLTIFEEKRDIESGKLFSKRLDEQLVLLPANATALLAHPMAVMLSCILFASSFYIKNRIGTFARIFSTFFVGLLDIVMSCNKFATVCIE